jgi:hypothetical protein
MSTAGVAGVAYAAVLILSMLPGIPLGVRLFGPRHAASLLSGALLGYGITTLTAWTSRLLFPGSATAIILGWACAAAVSWLAFRRSASGREPWLIAPAWERRDTLALVPVLLLAAALTLPALSNINVKDDEGIQRIRAYFTADFVWHMALVAELQKGAQPPVNPFLAPPERGRHIAGRRGTADRRSAAGLLVRASTRDVVCPGPRGTRHRQRRRIVACAGDCGGRLGARVLHHLESVRDASQAQPDTDVGMINWARVAHRTPRHPVHALCPEPGRVFKGR